MRVVQATIGATLSQLTAQGHPPASKTKWGLRTFIAGLAAALWGVDLATKQWAIAHLDPGNPPSFFGGFLKFRLIFNPGAAFSMGTNFTIGLSIFALVAFVVVVFWFVPRVGSLKMAAVVGMLLAGIAGNLTDRLFRAPGPFRGHVVDFISLPRFAIFNWADVCITGAAILLVLIALVTDKDAGKTAKDS